MSAEIQTGDTIAAHYTGKFENGEVFDTSKGSTPLEFTVGQNQTIAGFDEAVIGMKKGDKKTVTIPPDKAYGQHDPQYVVKVPTQAVSEGMAPTIGQRVELRNQHGQPVSGFIIAMNDQEIDVDINHPLAGRTLVFDISIAETGLLPMVQQGCGCGGEGHDHGEEEHSCGCGGHDDEDHVCGCKTDDEDGEGGHGQGGGGCGCGGGH